MRKKAAEGPRYFQTTQWSMVAKAGAHDVDPAQQKEALVTLLNRYMPVLHSYLIYRKGFDSHEADDLLQGFLLSHMVEHDLISSARRELGSFRALLLTALNRYVIDQIRRAQALKRGKGVAVSIDDNMDAAAPAPADSFDLDWARELLSQAVRQMHEECRATGREDVWAIFDARILGPALRQQEPMPYEQLVERFGLVSPAQASNLLITGRRSFVRVLRALIAEYEPDEQRVDLELNELQRILGQAPAEQHD